MAVDSWNSEKLWLKAKVFISHANEHEHKSSMFAFWSALALECLARSALTHVHPTLNADPRDDVNLLYALGFELTAKPRSLPAHSVFIRLEKIVPEFKQPQRELCEFVALLRNAHVHTADLPYENLSSAKWLPRYYETLKVLSEFRGGTIEDFLGPDIAGNALELIKTLNEKLLGSVKQKIAAYQKVFYSKPKAEQHKLAEGAVAATLLLPVGQTSDACPACKSDAILTGTKAKEFSEKYENGQLLMDVEYMTVEFKCVACGLALTGIEEIAHAGLAMHFTETVATSLHELYEPEYEAEYDNM